MVTITGMSHHRAVRVTWQQGYLAGDAELIAEVQLQARLLDGQPVGPPEGPYTWTDHLCTATSALLLLRETLDVVTAFRGEHGENEAVEESTG